MPTIRRALAPALAAREGQAAAWAWSLRWCNEPQHDVPVMKAHTKALIAPPKLQQGVAAVELGLLLLVLVTLAFSVAELGRAVYQYNAIAKGVRDGARYLSQKTPGVPAPGQPPNPAVPNAKNLVVYGSIVNTGQPAAPGLSVDMVEVCDLALCPATHDSGGASSLGPGVSWVTVTVTGYQFVSLVSFVVGNLDFPPISATFTQIQ
jgi:hypothetical protein